MTDAVLMALILAPAIITFFLKSDAAMGFLVLCVGFVLTTSVIGDLKQLLSQADLSVTESTLALVLLVVPLLITLALLRSGKRKGLKFWLQIITALLAGGLLAISVGPIVNGSSGFDLDNSQVWEQLIRFQSLVIGAGATLALMLAWLGGHHKTKKH